MDWRRFAFGGAEKAEAAAPPPPPAGFAALGSGLRPPSADWVGEFNDGALNILVADALANNPDIVAARERLAQFDALARQAGSARKPTLDASLGAARSQSVIDAAEPIDFETASLDLSLSASWEADLWGRLAARAKAGALDAEAAAADLEDAKLSIAGAVSQGWFDLIEARQQTLLSEDEVATQEQSLRLTMRRFEAGVAGALDVRLARSQLASSQATLAQRRNAETAAARRLEVLLGRYPRAEMAAAASFPKLPELSGAGAPGELLARRPDLRAAEARLAADGLRAIEARRALLPRLSLSAGGGTVGDAGGELFDPDYLVGSIAASLLQPIYRGGALRAEKDRAAAAARESLALYVRASLAAYREAEDALDLAASFADQEAALAVAAEEANAAEDLAVRNYTSGVGTIFELLDAQRRRISAERALIGVRSARLSNRVDLHLAIAGPFAASPAAEPPGDGGKELE